MSEKPQHDDPDPPEDGQAESEDNDAALLREQLEEALREKAQFRAMAQRAQADLINYRRRAAEEREELARTANLQLLLKMLSVADNLNRALETVPGDADASGWLEGVRLVQRSLEHILESEGVTKIETEGQPFDPWEHEAVFSEETPDAQEGLIVRIIRDGYKLHDRVLRAAQVSVSKAPELERQQDTTQQEA